MCWMTVGTKNHSMKQDVLSSSNGVTVIHQSFTMHFQLLSACSGSLKHIKPSNCQTNGCVFLMFVVVAKQRVLWQAAGGKRNLSCPEGHKTCPKAWKFPSLGRRDGRSTQNVKGFQIAKGFMCMHVQLDRCRISSYHCWTGEVSVLISATTWQPACVWAGSLWFKSRAALPNTGYQPNAQLRGACHVVD